MITKKNLLEQEYMRVAGRILASVFSELQEAAKVGVSTKFLDDKAYSLIKSHSCEPAFLDYSGFPATICASLNNEVVHGIPSDRVILKKGDIFSIDIGLIYKEYYADMAKTIAIGNISKRNRLLIDETKASLADAIKKVVPGNTFGDIGAAIQQRVERNGLSVVREYVGHGIGKELHEEPQIFNYGLPGQGVKIEEGMVFAIEPMVNLGGWKTKVLKDGWTVVTKDGSLSAHFEHTVLVTSNGQEVLTIDQ
ncbi:MAG: type I methionyl aminopeptidase [bacterium]|nr:type I methionyl aminopeptidase [bacterium]